MSFSFNLIDERWMPCIRNDGSRDELGLRNVLAQAHQLREIVGDTPLETVTLHRLLLVILHRVFGPESRSAWVKLWQSSSGFAMTDIEAYLARPDIYKRFDLFDPEKPFFQSRYPKAGEKSVISMVLQMASGNNATLFDHHTEADGAALSPAQAARSLLVSQLFGFGGLSGLPEKFTDAPCAKNIIFLASGANLFETLLLNLVIYDEDEPMSAPNNDDCPVWEMDDPFIPDRTIPNGYLDYLTWHNRRIWLFPEETSQGTVVRRMSWAPGLRLDSHTLDPMSQYIASQDKKSDLQVLRFQADRSLWRDSNTLFQIGTQDKCPASVSWMANLATIPPKVLDKSHRYQLMALGMAKSRASLEFLRAETLPLPVELLTQETCVADLTTALTIAEKVGKLLNRCTYLIAWLVYKPTTPDEKFDEPKKNFDEQTLIDNKLKAGQNDKSKDKEAQQTYKLFSSFGIERLYWSQLENHFYRFLQNLPDQPEAAVKEWRGHLRRTARAVFTQAQQYAGNDRRALRASVQAEAQFERGLAWLLSIQQPKSNPGGDSHDAN